MLGENREGIMAGVARRQGTDREQCRSAELGLDAMEMGSHGGI